MKCVIVTLLLLAAAENISAGVSTYSESSGSYSGSINGKPFGGSYRTPNNGPTIFNHYGDDAARSAGVLPYGGRNSAASDVFGRNDGFGSPVSHFSNPTDMDSDFNQAYSQHMAWVNAVESENKPSRRRIVMSPSPDSTESLAESYADNFRRSMSQMESFPFTRPQRFRVTPSTRTDSRFPDTEDDSFPPARPQSFLEMSPPRTVPRFPDTEDRSFRSARPAHSQRFQGMRPSRTDSGLSNTEDDRYRPARPAHSQTFQGMPPSRTDSGLSNTEDDRYRPARPAHSQTFQGMPPSRTNSGLSNTEDDRYRPARPAHSQRFQGIPSSRTDSGSPNTEDDSYVPGQGFAMLQQKPISTTTPEPELKSDFPTEAPRSSANASVQFPRDGKPSPFMKRVLKEKLAWDAEQKAKEAASANIKPSNDIAPQASASESGSIGPGGSQ